MQDWEKVAYWLKKLKNGDEKAFSQVVKILHPIMHRLVQRIVFNSCHVEEAIDDAFCKMYHYRHVAPANNVKHLKNWCYLLFKQVAFTIKPDPKSEPIDSKAEYANIKKWENDKRWLEMFKVIEDELKKISIKYREPFQFHYEFNYKYEEIAEMLNKPIGTIKSRLRKAKALLRLRLRREGLL